MVITHIEDVLPSRHGKLSTNRRADVERVELHLVHRRRSRVVALRVPRSAVGDSSDDGADSSLLSKICRN